MQIGWNSIDYNRIRMLENGAGDKALKDSLKGAVEKHDEERLKDACRSFESLLLQIMYKRMKDTVPKSGLVSGGLAENIFESMLDDKLMEEAAKTGSFGLAEAMYRQLSK